MLEARLLVLRAPPNDAGAHVDVGPSQLADSADPVSGLVHEHGRHAKAPIDLGGHPEQGLAFRLRENHPGWVLQRLGP